MKQHIRKPYPTQWIPRHLRRDRWGELICHRKPDPGLPLFRLEREGNDLYFINESQEVLSSVIASSGGYETTDDGPVSWTSSQDYHYKDVQPQEALLIDQYDGYYDLDYVISVYLTVDSPSLGKIRIRPPSEKGGVEDCILLWDTGEVGRYVSVDPAITKSNP